MGDLLELLGLGCLVGFAFTLGPRWGLLALGVVLVLLSVTGFEMPKPKIPRRIQRMKEPPYGSVRFEDM